MKPAWRGRWRLVESDLWDEEALDLLEPAYLELGADRLGQLVVGALQADLDYRVAPRDGGPAIEFSWEGDDDGHPTTGRGWARLAADRSLHVKLFIHRGDEITLKGAALAATATRRSAARKRARAPRR